MKRTIIILGLVAAAAALQACRPNTSFGALVSHEWTLDEIIYDDSSYTITPPTEVSIIFTDSGTVHGRATCNSYFGVYTPVDEDRINIEIKGSTLAWCEYMSFEERYFAILDLAGTFDADRDNLRIRDEASRVTLSYRPSFIQ